MIEQGVHKKLGRLSNRYCFEQGYSYQEFVDIFVSFILRYYINIDEAVKDCTEISIIKNEISNALSVSVALNTEKLHDNFVITEEMVYDFENWMDWLDRNSYIMRDNEFDTEYGYERSELDGCVKEDYRREFYEFMEEMEIYE